MRNKLREQYKNAKNIDFLYDLKKYQGLKTSVIIPYFIMLSPIILAFVSIILWWSFEFDNSFFGWLFTFPIWLIFVSISIYIIVDVRRIVIGFMDKKIDISPKNTLKGIKQYPEVLFLFLMAVWILIATFANPDAGKVFSIVRPNNFLQEGTMYYLGYFLAFIFAFYLKDQSIYKRILIAFLISSIFGAITTFIDPAGQFFLASHNNTCWAFTMMNSNHYGYFLTLAIGASATLYLTEKQNGMKIFAGLTFLLNTIVLFFNDTLGCLLAVLITLILVPVIFAIKNKKFDWQTILPLGIFVSLSFIITPLAKFFPTSTYKSLAGQIAGLIKEIFSIAEAPLSEEASHAGTDRWSLWLKAFAGIKENLLFGTGDVVFKPHNEYLQHAYNFGVLALVFYLASLVIILVKTLKNLRFLSDITLVFESAVITYLISAIFGNTMPHTFPYFLVIFAFAIRLLNFDIIKRKTADKDNTNITNIQVKINKSER